MVQDGSADGASWVTALVQPAPSPSRAHAVPERRPTCAQATPKTGNVASAAGAGMHAWCRKGAALQGLGAPRRKHRSQSVRGHCEGAGACRGCRTAQRCHARAGLAWWLPSRAGRRACRPCRGEAPHQAPAQPSPAPCASICSRVTIIKPSVHRLDSVTWTMLVPKPS